MIDDILAGLFGVALFNVTVDAQWKHNAGVARGEGKVLGVLRVREGEVPKLSRTRWSQFEVTPSANAIRFEFVPVAVTDVRPSTRTLGRGDNSLAPMQDLTLLEVHSTDAVLEWAMLPQDVEWVTAKILVQAIESPA